MGVRRRRMLGDDASVLAAAIAAGGGGAPSSALVSQTVQTAMNNGALWTKEDCSGIVSGKSTASLVLSTAGAAAIKFAGATGPAAPFVMIAGGIMQVFGAIFGHHAAKVKQEQQIICAVVQSVNDSLSVIDQAVQQGVITADQASASLDKLYSDLQANVQPILKQDSGHCNAACFELAEARGVIGKRKEQYAAIAQQQAQAAAAAAAATAAAASASAGNILSAGNPLDGANSLVDQLATSFNVPTWAVWAIGAAAAAKVLRVI